MIFRLSEEYIMTKGIVTPNFIFTDIEKLVYLIEMTDPMGKT